MSWLPLYWPAAQATMKFPAPSTATDGDASPFVVVRSEAHPADAPTAGVAVRPDPRAFLSPASFRSVELRLRPWPCPPAARSSRSRSCPRRRPSGRG
jgi:hypothetical protein